MLERGQDALMEKITKFKNEISIIRKIIRKLQIVLMKMVGMAKWVDQSTLA